MSVIKKRITIKNKLGLHARPAAMFVQIANKYDCAVSLTKGKQTVNGKSIMGIMMLAAGKGSQVYIVCDGDDAKQAFEELESLLSGELDEVKK